MEQKLPIQKNTRASSATPSFWDAPFLPPAYWGRMNDPFAWHHDIFDTARRNMHPLENFLPGFPEFTMQPTADVSEDRESIRIKMNVPGLDADDIRISSEDGMLNISADKQEKKNGTESRFSFSYSTSLPESADIDDADVSLANHRLNIRIPKRSGTAQKLSIDKSKEKTGK